MTTKKEAPASSNNKPKTSENSINKTESTISKFFDRFKGSSEFLKTKEGDYQISGQSRGDHNLYGGMRKDMNQDDYFFLRLGVDLGQDAVFHIGNNDQIEMRIEEDETPIMRNGMLLSQFPTIKEESIITQDALQKKLIKHLYTIAKEIENRSPEKPKN